MKKFILIAFLVIFSLSAFAFTPDLKSKSETPAVPAQKENKMSDEEINSLTRRVEEIHNGDKSKQTVVVQESGPRRGHHGMNRGDRRGGGYVFVGGGAVLLLIILIIILV